MSALNQDNIRGLIVYEKNGQKNYLFCNLSQIVFVKSTKTK